MNVNEIRNPALQWAQLQQAQKKAGQQFENQLTSAASTPAQSTPDVAPAALTEPEQSFFEQLYPAQASEVKAYNPYTSAGTTTSVRLGTIVDRKG